jgi:hypothetical protein
MQEKRRAKRVEEKAKFTIKLPSSDTELDSYKIIRDLTKDLSVAGVRIQCKTLIPVNTLIKLELKLEKPDRLITAAGLVRWAKSIYGNELFEMGIEFVDPSSEVVQILKNHLERFMD